MSDSATDSALPGTVAGLPSAKSAGWCTGLLVATANSLVLFAALYALCAFVLPRGVDLVGSPGNAFFDMDTARVIGDWTSLAEFDRSRAHPLYKFLAFPGMAINALFFRGENATAAVRLMCIAGVLIHAMMAGFLAWQLAGGNRLAGIVAGIVVAASFPSFLLAGIPDSAALSGIATLAPFLCLYSRRGKPLVAWEIVVWVLLGVIGFGITISQVLFVFIAFFFRLWWAIPAEKSWPARAKWGAGWSLAMLVPLVLAVYLSLQLHGLVFGGGDRHYKVDRIVEKEMKYVETDELSSIPHVRFWRLLRQWSLYNFVAPTPGIATWNPPRDERQFISITQVETTAQNWRWWHLPVLLSQVALLGLVIACGRHRWELLPILCGLAFQFALHFVYGREFVIYALNWHGLFVAWLVALVPVLWLQRAPIAAALWIVLHVAAMAAINVAMMAEVFRVYTTEFPLEQAWNLIRLHGLE